MATCEKGRLSVQFLSLLFSLAKVKPIFASNFPTDLKFEWLQFQSRTHVIGEGCSDFGDNFSSYILYIRPYLGSY